MVTSKNIIDRHLTI